ncbi:MAG: FAD-dependent oxidoreductase [Solirubrobacteraceae bacterium]|nr:FAD-dependent oxidoreductase [Solirubrobacteraceae bacterium]
MSPFSAVICGAGIAGVEAALRLRRLAGADVEVTLVDPGESLVYRPLAVREPFALSGVRRYPLRAIADAIGAQWRQDGVDGVDPAAGKVHLAGGTELGYDALLLALGGHEASPHEHAHVFNDRNAGETFHGIVQDIEDGYITSLVLIEPDGPTWPLPLYELALMTAERAYSMNASCEITFLTARQRPLDAFGGGAAEAVERLLADAGIVLHAGATPRVEGARHVVVDQDTELRPQRVVTLPRITGPQLAGISGVEPYGLLAIDDVCRVRDLDGRVFAAGDLTDFAVKHGGISAQQADTAAAGIAHLAGIGEAPGPFKPVVRGMLLTGRKPLFISAHLAEGRGWHSEVHDEPPWQSDEKVVAEELGPFLREQDQAAPRP